MIFNPQTEKLEKAHITTPLLRFARNLPDLQKRLDPLLSEPVNRALCGLQDCEPVKEGNLQQQILSAAAYVAAGHSLDAGWAAQLEKNAEGDKKC